MFKIILKRNFTHIAIDTIIIMFKHKKILKIHSPHMSANSNTIPKVIAINKYVPAITYENNILGKWFVSFSNFTYWFSPIVNKIDVAVKIKPSNETVSSFV